MKELIKEVQELSVVADEIKSILELTLDKSYQLSTKEERGEYFSQMQNSLSVAIKHLETNLASKLFDMDCYTSIKAEEYKPNFKIESAS